MNEFLSPYICNKGVDGDSSGEVCRKTVKLSNKSLSVGSESLEYILPRKFHQNFQLKFPQNHPKIDKISSQIATIYEK